MNRVLILYGSTEGHTRVVARAIARTLALNGLNADVVEAGSADPDPTEYAGIIVAASIHAGRYQKPVVQWVRARCRVFGDRPTAFVSVCLGVLEHGDPTVTADLDAIVQRFCEATGWRPGFVKHVAGALLYTRYDFVTRWMMKRIAAKAGGDTDTTRDYEYTDWDDVRAFADEFGRRLAPQRVSDTRRAS